MATSMDYVPRNKAFKGDPLHTICPHTTNNTANGAPLEQQKASNGHLFVQVLLFYPLYFLGLPVENDTVVAQSLGFCRKESQHM